MAKKEGEKTVAELLEEMLKEREEIVKNQRALNDAFLDLKEKSESDGGREKAGLVLVNTIYKTPDSLAGQICPPIVELTDIPHLMCRPIASLYTLERIGSKAVRSGKESLLTTYMNIFLRARRSIEGKHLAKGRMLASDQLSQVGKEEGIEGFDVGREQ